MGPDLIFTPALGAEDAEGQQFSLLQVQVAPGIKVAKAVGGEVVLDMLLILRGGGDMASMLSPEIAFWADSPFSSRSSSVTVPARSSGSWLPRCSNTWSTACTACSAFPRPI